MRFFAGINVQFFDEQSTLKKYLACKAVVHIRILKPQKESRTLFSQVNNYSDTIRMLYS
jgi:hypothetical protein